MQYITLRVREDTHRKLKVVAALAQESMLDALDRLVTQEYDRLLQQKGGKEHVALEKDQTPRE
jgi:hypothetical protein